MRGAQDVFTVLILHVGIIPAYAGSTAYIGKDLERE